ncbi:V-set and immunoglobulin domain-containing protein 10-like 2 [Grus japonensis]
MPANRSHAGWYACTVRNEVNNRTSEPVYLDIVYGPDEPAISVEPFSPEQGGFSAGEREDVVLSCLAPSNPPSRYVWLHNGSQVHTGQTYVIAAIARTQAGTYTCLAENTHLHTRTQATIVLTVYWVPAGGPSCAAAATKSDEYVMLRCWWEGGTPPVTLRWRDGGGRALGDPAPSAAVLVLSADGSLGGRDFVCVATHPLWTAGAECRLRLEVPELEAERREVAVLEGGEARLACQRRSGGADLGARVVWYDPKAREVTPGLAKYRLEREEAWVNLTVRDAEWPGDSGIYHCTAANAVGTASLPVRLRVDRYPAPPNVTISKLRYTRARTEVRLEWRTQGAGNLTGFVVQRRQAKKTHRRAPGPWETAAGDIEPHSRDRRVGGLDPAVVYAFRVLAVNHRTAGHPSEVQTPAEPPFEAYPAVTGAAVAGMLVATTASLLAVRWVARHQDTLPQLRSAPLDVTDEPPVNVTITMTATP